jgi:hypothetical protein
MEQAHADQPPVVIDTLDRVSVQLELADDGGWEVNPGGVQLGKATGWWPAWSKSLQQLLLLGVSERHRRIVALQWAWGRVGRFQAVLLPLDVWRLGVWAAHRCVPPQSTHLRSWPLAWRRCRAEAEAQVARFAWRSRGVGGRRVGSRWRKRVMLV